MTEKASKNNRGSAPREIGSPRSINARRTKVMLDT